MHELFVCQQNTAYCDGFEETDEMIAHKNHGSWAEIDSYRNILVSHQRAKEEAEVEDREQSLARFLTLGAVLEHGLLSQ
jgi:hypothetical protein